MYRKDISIVQGSSEGAPVPAGADPKLAAFLSERTACVVGDKLMERKGWKLGQTVHVNGTIYPGSWPFVIRAVYHPNVKTFDAETMFFHWDYLYENTAHRAQVGIWTFALADPSQAATIGKRVDALFENSA